MRRKISIFVGSAIIAGAVLVVNMDNTQQGTRYAVAPFAVYETLRNDGWDIGAPRWKPDGTLVLFDRSGNLPFTPEQIKRLDKLKATIIAESGIAEYLKVNDWNIVEEER